MQMFFLYSKVLQMYFLLYSFKFVLRRDTEGMSWGWVERKRENESQVGSVLWA